MEPLTRDKDDPEEIYKGLLEEAKNDPNIIGFFLGGSRGKGVFTKYSDYDILYITSDEKIEEYRAKYPRYKYPNMELMKLSISQFRNEAAWGSPGQWGRYDFAWITAAVDKTGEIQRLIDEKGRIPPEHVKEFVERQLDTYINQFYRSLKCFRDSLVLGARLEVNVGVECLLNVLFALHSGRLKPFYKYLAWELEAHPLQKVPYTPGELMGKIARILDDADVETQCEMFLMVEKLCRDEGFGCYIDQWDDSPDQDSFAVMRYFKQQKTLEVYRGLAHGIPLLEYDPAPRARIEPSQPPVQKPDRHPGSGSDVAEHCIVCFFKDVIGDLLAKPETHEVGREHSVMGDFPIYETAINGKRIAFFHPGVGAPLCVSTLEYVIQLGCKKFVAIGSAGAIRGNLPPDLIVVPVTAIRDEGTSYHYIAPGRETHMNPAVLAAIESELERRNEKYIKAKTWTTDAFYRETPAKIELRRNEGCATVEMEAAAFFAVAQFRNVLLGQLLYCDDDVSGESWKAWDGRDPKALHEKLFSIAVDICFKL